jgi:uncharacterized protein
MIQRFRNWLRAWLREPIPPASAEEKPKGMSIPQQMLVKAGEHGYIIARPLAPPELPPIVRGDFAYDAANDPGHLGEPTLAYDDSANAPMWAYLNQANCGMGFPGYGYLAELSQRSEYRAPTETLAKEATREWIDITVKGKASQKKRKARGEDTDGEPVDQGLEDKIEAIEAAFEKFKIRDHFCRISEWDGYFGRAQLFIDLDPGSADPDELRQLPLVLEPETVKKGSLRGFKVIEPIWTTPYSYNTTDPTAGDFYKPRAWFVIGKRTHASRLLTFISREVPDILKPAYNFGGLSMSQLMEPYVFQWLRTRNSVSDLIHNFSVMCLQTDMQAVLQGDPAAGQSLMDRAKLFTQTRDNQGLTLLDKTREELINVQVSLANLDKLQAQSQEHMAAPSHVPLVKLMGVTPSGLNASSEGEIKVWYDWVRSYQLFFYGPHLKNVLDVIQLNEFGQIDDAIGINFVPLSSPTVKELSEIRKANSETDSAYVTMGAVSPDEVRERIAADPMSGFDNLSGPAPEPPEKDLAAHGAELDEDKAQADHKRGLETQAAASKLKQQESKANGKQPPGK